MHVVTFTDYTPIPRFDGVPWNRVRIEESAVETGPWTQIDLINLLPLDSDPKNPATRSFTTDNATINGGGWYRVVFLDQFAGNELPTVPIHDVPAETLPYRPTVVEVAAKLRARTKDKNGVEVGSFTGDTRPTFEQAEEAIDSAMADVTAEIDTDIPEEAWDAVRKLVALRSAMEIELSYFPEQVGTNRSAFNFYKDLYDAGLKRVMGAVTRETYELTAGEIPELDVTYNFPVAPTNWDRVTW